jgi:hypothetical protein
MKEEIADDVEFMVNIGDFIPVYTASHLRRRYGE